MVIQKRFQPPPSSKVVIVLEGHPIGQRVLEFTSTPFAKRSDSKYIDYQRISVIPDGLYLIPESN